MTDQQPKWFSVCVSGWLVDWLTYQQTDWLADGQDDFQFKLLTLSSFQKRQLITMLLQNMTFRILDNPCPAYWHLSSPKIPCFTFSFPRQHNTGLTLDHNIKSGVRSGPKSLNNLVLVTSINKKRTTTGMKTNASPPTTYVVILLNLRSPRWRHLQY